MGHPHRHSAAHRPPPDADGLLCLLELEAALAVRHAAAVAEADQLIAEARRRVTDLEAAAATELAMVAEQLATRIGHEQEQEARRVVQEAAARAERLRRIPDSQVVDLAAQVVRRVLAPSEGQP